MIAASTPMVHRRRRRIFSETCLSPATETVHHREAHASSGVPHERSDFVGRTSEEANVLSSQDRPHTARVATVAPGSARNDNAKTGTEIVYPTCRSGLPLALNRAISIGPSENSPRRAFDVRSRK